jgi:glyoxylase-like metal-dependent hydrolase (beta-lactamase superfamily II)
MIIKKITNTPIDSNCYVLYETNNKNCILIDPGSKDNSNILTYLKKHELNPEKIILTHEHFDHIWGVLDLSKEYNFDLICNYSCMEAIKNPKRNLSIFYNQIGFAIFNNVVTIDELDNKLNWNNKLFEFFNSPGHSEGSISIIFEDMLFCGDILIQNQKTVTKFPGGSIIKLSNTLNTIKENYSPNTLILSGHGETFLLKDYFNYENI